MYVYLEMTCYIRHSGKYTAPKVKMVATETI